MAFHVNRLKNPDHLVSTVCKGRVYTGSAELGLKLSTLAGRDN